MKSVAKTSKIMPPKKKVVEVSTKKKVVEKKRKVTEKSDILEEEEFVSVPEEKKTSPYMSIYEYTALIRARALQLGTPGAEPKIELDPENPEEYDPINIATREVRECLITLIIRRTLTDGSTEDWYPKDMIFPRM